MESGKKVNVLYVGKLYIEITIDIVENEPGMLQVIEICNEIVTCFFMCLCLILDNIPYYNRSDNDIKL